MFSYRESITSLFSSFSPSISASAFIFIVGVFHYCLIGFFCSNILFREFSLISMWRVPAMPIGAHTLLSLLAEPMKQATDILLSTEDHVVSENLREFEDWVCF